MDYGSVPGGATPLDFAAFDSKPKGSAPLGPTTPERTPPYRPGVLLPQPSIAQRLNPLPTVVTAPEVQVRFVDQWDVKQNCSMPDMVDLDSIPPYRFRLDAPASVIVQKAREQSFNCKSFCAFRKRKSGEVRPTGPWRTVGSKDEHKTVQEWLSEEIYNTPYYRSGMPLVALLMRDLGVDDAQNEVYLKVYSPSPSRTKSPVGFERNVFEANDPGEAVA